MNRFIWILTFGVLLAIQGLGISLNAHLFAADYEPLLPSAWTSEPYSAALRLFQAFGAVLMFVGLYVAAFAVLQLKNAPTPDASTDQRADDLLGWV